MSKLVKFTGILAVAIFAAAQANADTIATWTFETSAPVTAGPFSPEVGSGAAMGGTGGTYSSPAGPGSAHSFSSTAWDVGDYWQFQVNLTGYSSVNIDWYQASSTTGPRTFKLQTSTDGSIFTDYGFSYLVDSNAAPEVTWSSGGSLPSYTNFHQTVSITGLDNQATAYFRLVDTSTTSEGGNAGVVAATGTDRVDNFNVTATLVPEPSSVVLVGAGLMGLLALRRRRS